MKIGNKKERKNEKCVDKDRTIRRKKENWFIKIEKYNEWEREEWRLQEEKYKQRKKTDS